MRQSTISGHTGKADIVHWTVDRMGSLLVAKSIVTSVYRETNVFVATIHTVFPPDRKMGECSILGLYHIDIRSVFLLRCNVIKNNYEKYYWTFISISHWLSTFHFRVPVQLWEFSCSVVIINTDSKILHTVRTKHKYSQIRLKGHLCIANHCL